MHDPVGSLLLCASPQADHVIDLDVVHRAGERAGAAAVAATTGLPAVTAGAAGMAAVLSTLSTAAGHGSAGAIIIAGSGLPPRSARGRPGDDRTGAARAG